MTSGSALRVRHILLATDFSRGAEEAAQWAAELSRVFAARLLLLHVVDLTLFGVAGLPSHAGASPLVAEVTERLRAQAAVEMTGLERRLRPAETRIQEGSPRELILQVASDVEADLIVMGTQGRTGLARVLLGSVAEYVVRHSAVPVLTIRRTSE
jgi:nucleotide-binding universal stress UspA family protein